MSDPPLLEASAVEVHYRGMDSPAVCDADITVAEGARIGIVGESGSGKTTLGRVLVGALEPSTGSVRVGGRPWSETGRKDPLRRSVQMIFQDPYKALNPMLTAHQTVAEVLRVHQRLPRSLAGERADQILRDVQLSEAVTHRRPNLLSGGQCQRVGIARALACEPKVLVADEPTSSLDVSVQAQILNLLLDLCEQRGLALVLVSHDLAVVEYATREAIVMYGGRIVERGPTSDLLTRPRHPYTRQLVDSVPRAGLPLSVEVVPRINAGEQSGCVFASRCLAVQPDCLTGQPAFTRLGSQEVACLHPCGAPATGAAPPLAGPPLGCDHVPDHDLRREGAPD